MNDVVITVEGLRKRYGETAAVDGIGFEVHRGEIFGLLGPNGAGKTTTLECLEGLREADEGRISILGIDPAAGPRAIAKVIGVQLQTSGLPGTMRVDEAMRLFSAYHHVAPRYDLLERLGLGAKRTSQYRRLSVGLKRRLELALAVAHNPSLVLFDEPTAGLDVESRNELHALMTELRAEGTAIILATHDMAEAEKLSDRVAILLQGRIAALGTPRELTAAGAGLTKVSVRSERSTLRGRTLDLPSVENSAESENYAIYLTTDPGATVAALLAALAADEDPLIDLRVERPSLEERFLEITRQGVRR